MTQIDARTVSVDGTLETDQSRIKDIADVCVMPVPTACRTAVNNGLRTERPVVWV